MKNDWSGIGRWARKVFLAPGDEPWEYDRANQLDDLATAWVDNDRVAWASDEKMRENL